MSEPRKMLYLSRAPGESVDLHFGGHVVSVLIKSVVGKRVNMQFRADKSVIILRSEVELKKENVQ